MHVRWLQASNPRSTLPRMTQEQLGPGMVPLDRFVAARLDEDPVTTPREQAEAEVKRKVLDAYSRTRPFTVHRAGFEVALKAMAGIWSSHVDYDPTWRL